MEATQSLLTTFLQGPKQYIIPIYQRTYRWTENQCEQLWDDIVRISQNENISSHFIGSVVYIHRGLYHSSAVNSLLVIDGQQRLTTLTLLLTAIRKKLEESDSTKINKNQINNYYLFNNEEEGDNRHKLVLTKSDKETLFSLLEETPLPTNYSKNIVDNYEYFLKQITKSEISLDSLYQGIRKLVIVDISLDNINDNPQLIFESLNSTGLELSQADLIRNFVLMGLEIKTQTEIYENFWFPMEQSFGHSQGSENFDRFMRDYLTTKLTVIPKEREVYVKFKEYFSTKTNPIQEIVKDIYYYSKIFTILAFGNTSDQEIKTKIDDINSLRVDVVYPFLLDVFADYQKNIISRNDLLIILDMVESYVFRRQICDVPTNSLNKIFATLYGLVDKDNYLESLQANFLLKDSYRRFPNNAEFHEKFMTKNVYNFRTNSYLFRKLENFNRKELVNFNEYTLEHIMPQNEKISQEWKDELGVNWKEIHEKYLHRIGNLTLTGYNSELSDKPFTEKQNMSGGFKDSPIRLNSELATLEHWNEDEIKNRSKILADKAMNIWKYPSLPQNILSKYQSVEEDDDDEDEDDKNGVNGWEVRRNRATERIKKLQDRIVSEISEKFDCIVEPHKQHLMFYIEKPLKPKNQFALMNCGKDVSSIMFRINPDTFVDDENVRIVKGWFFPEERRIHIKEENFSHILEKIEHAYNTTKNS